jgi:hypothetical protein
MRSNLSKKMAMAKVARGMRTPSNATTPSKMVSWAQEYTTAYQAGLKGLPCPNDFVAAWKQGIEHGGNGMKTLVIGYVGNNGIYCPTCGREWMQELDPQDVAINGPMSCDKCGVEIAVNDLDNASVALPAEWLHNGAKVLRSEPIPGAEDEARIGLCVYKGEYVVWMLVDGHAYHGVYSNDLIIASSNFVKRCQKHGITKFDDLDNASTVPMTSEPLAILSDASGNPVFDADKREWIVAITAESWVTFKGNEMGVTGRAKMTVHGLGEGKAILSGLKGALLQRIGSALMDMKAIKAKRVVGSEKRYVMSFLGVTGSGPELISEWTGLKFKAIGLPGAEWLEPEEVEAQETECEHEWEVDAYREDTTNTRGVAYYCVKCNALSL